VGTVPRRPLARGRGRHPGQGVGDQTAVSGLAERVRPVPRLQVDDGAAPGRLGPADEVAGRRVLPRRTGPRGAQYLVVGLPERPVGCVRPQQRDDVRGEHRAVVQLVAQLEVAHAGAHRMARVDHPRGVARVPEARVRPVPAAEPGGRVVIAAPEHLGPARPGGPAGQRVVQEHEALAGLEQLRQPPGHPGGGRERLRRRPAPQGQARQVVTEDSVEHAAVLRAEPVLRGRLHRMREHPAALGADSGQHAGERVQVDPVTPGHGQEPHAYRAPASRARRKKSAPAAVYPPST
jgi:hypothetical protein